MYLQSPSNCCVGTHADFRQQSCMNELWEQFSWLQKNSRISNNWNEGDTQKTLENIITGTRMQAIISGLGKTTRNITARHRQGLTREAKGYARKGLSLKNQRRCSCLVTREAWGRGYGSPCSSASPAKNSNSSIMGKGRCGFLLARAHRDEAGWTGERISYGYQKS